MTVQARRRIDFPEVMLPEVMAAASSEEIRAHVRARLERLVSTLRADGAVIRLHAE
ncbi:hypothetical protein [Methylobacterium platani]|uniref:hypothetical protein n=1 Tax=Methylobacterium platani TaxID=427683 RepID=UPI0012E0E2EF|nr:hypothetical protein [Methylobacterium platani]